MKQKTWADIDEEETRKQSMNDYQQQEDVLDKNSVVDLLDEVVEVLDNVVTENKEVINEVVTENKEVINEVVTENKQNLPNMVILPYELISLIDNKQNINNKDLNEITKIIIGRGGYYLKEITSLSGVITIWCRTDDKNNKIFDIHQYNNDYYGSNIAYWMLKKRINYVVQDFYERRKS